MKSLTRDATIVLIDRLLKEKAAWIRPDWRMYLSESIADELFDYKEIA